MRVSSLYENSKKPVISMEFFPPRDEKAAGKFGAIIDKLAELKPDYMSVTFGAGGSNRDGSYQTVKNIMDKKLPTVAYIAGLGLGPDEITEVLDKYKGIGVETIFVIRGDKPRDDNYTPHPDSFSYASEMLGFIKERYDFTLGCAGYPEGHIEAESLEKDIEFLKLKEKNGAEYVIAQYCYDNNYFFEYIKKCRAAGINIPIIPGIMPIYTVKMTKILSKVCGTTIADDLQGKLDELAKADKDDVLNFGIDFAVEQCRGLLKNGVAGLHFYTMDRSKSTTEIINRLRQENLL
ncbi:methylenetetrahydrofolate reductase (NADPH) [Desulfosarcina sp. BuS5]|uniref:methylenetetrahydrofolate reductase n=1 Tax=Desulfosarcina sp. BuS5 TaxID=933262 RepID=UPI000482ECFE|nr:methylenetetrahydrofolate reductase [Desulfosarcina sp. BuS5]WDN89330.1 methylenetetrahydrofolate reductase (NADPH) [Desulfosarcina sp. BuS5]